MPITNVGDTFFDSSKFPIHLRDIAITPDFIRNRVMFDPALTRQNPIMVEFDSFGFPIKDL